MALHMGIVFVGSVFATGIKMKKVESGLRATFVKLLLKPTLKWGW